MNHIRKPHIRIKKHGNTVDYTYVRVPDTGTGGGTYGVQGIQLYLKKIDYTGQVGLPAAAGKYSVIFIRDRELFEPRRPDVTIDARAGFKVVTADLLRKIEVKFKENLIRSYEFLYTEGAFKKTLLTAIVQYGQDGSEFNRHTFEYYDDVRTNGEYEGFATETEVNVGTDDVKTLLSDLGLGGISNEILRPSSLGCTNTSGATGHIFVGVKSGLPDTGKMETVGGKGGAGFSSTEGALALVDLNGDGLPDKVFRSGNQTYYRPQKIDGTFDYYETPIPTLNKLSVDESVNVSAGIETYIGKVNVMGDATWTFSTGKVYFSDVNSDGLIDLVDNGTVLFNRLEGGVPTFLEGSSDTPFPITSGELDPDLIEELKDLIDARKAASPLMDAVKSWEAPFSGRVRINGDVTYSTPEPDVYKYPDGLKVSIEYGGSTR